MALTEWQLSGVEFTNCNCNWGCPCQFNSLPSHGNCCALIFVQIESGRYGKVPLDGLRFGALWSWPKAVHMGNGTRQVILDERADAAQRAALDAICEGRDTEPGTLVWAIFATTVTTSLPTLVRPIDLAIDVDARTARVRVPGVAEGTGEPIRNAVTGAAQRVRVTLPAGFEFTEAEFASGRSRATAGVQFDFPGTHAHLARVRWSSHGVVR